MRRIGIAVLAALAVFNQAQAAGFTDPASLPGAIKGTMRIDFGTRTNIDATGSVPDGSPALGAVDTYSPDLTVMDSVLLKGVVKRQPWLPSRKLGITKQEGFFSYDVKCLLKNPANPSQTVTLGNWTGTTRLDGNGKYFLAQAPEGKGNLRIATESIGKIVGFTSPYAGEIQGRIPEQAGLWGMASRTSKKISKTYVRLSGGQAIKHVVKDADPMSFERVDLAQGPLAAYPLTRLNGSIDYDPEQGIWYVDVSMGYGADGSTLKDRFSGTIRWNEDQNRDQNGIGWYDVNVRINEKAASEEDVFTPTGTSTEDAFFAADNGVPGFIGKVSYVDTMEGGTVTSSNVTYAIDSNQASKIQTMNFAKILLLMIGPFNDE